MTNKELQALKERYVAAGAASPNEQFADHATNAELWDADGKRMIDFAGGIGVLNIGHRHPKVVEAVKAQLDKLMHTCQTVMPYEGYVRVAQKLSELTPVRGHAKVMLANSGAEALENAVKVARAATGRSSVICFTGGYHGRTFMTMAMNGKVAPYRNDFGPMPGQVYRAPYPVPSIGVSEEEALRHLKMTLKTDANVNDTAAIVIEPVLGEGGFHAAPASFLKAIREICDEHGILMVEFANQQREEHGLSRVEAIVASAKVRLRPILMTTAAMALGGRVAEEITFGEVTTGASNLDGGIAVAADKFSVDSAGAMKVTGAITATGVSNLDGGIAVDTNTFTVDGTSGNTAVKGSLVVTGASTATGLANLDGGIAVDTNKFTVDGANGATAITSTLAVKGDVAVNTNKFTVDAGNGNTVIAGTMKITGNPTLHILREPTVPHGI